MKSLNKGKIKAWIKILLKKKYIVIIYLSFWILNVKNETITAEHVNKKRTNPSETHQPASKNFIFVNNIHNIKICLRFNLNYKCNNKHFNLFLFDYVTQKLL